MKHILYIIALALLPVLSFGQEKHDNSKKELTQALDTGFVIKKIEPISANPLKQIEILNLKSEELISIKAYIKTLKLKRKETVLS